MDGYEHDAPRPGEQRNPVDADLAAAALVARGEGRHADAVELWRQLLRRRSEDWRAALDLKRDLAAGLHYSESDPLFRRAARHMPDAPWLAHYRALFAFHAGDLETLDARARAVAARRPDDPAAHTLLGDIARQRRDWTTAERAFEAALALDPNRAELADKLRAVRLRRRVARTLAARGGVLVSPGEFYGEAASAYVRVAVVQSDEQLELVARRLGVA